MAKVGDLIEAEWRDALRRWVEECKPGIGYELQNERYESILTRPGIWDAEVYECEFVDDDRGDLALYRFVAHGTRPPEWTESGHRQFDRARVIVIPQEEE